MGRGVRRGWEVLATLTLAGWVAGCGQAEQRRVLAVDLRTDYVPGTEFASVRAELELVSTDGGPSSRITNEVPVRLGDDFTRGSRLTDFIVAEPGTYSLTVTLLQLGGELVAQRSVRLQVRSGRKVTVVVTRSCATVRCPPDDGPVEATACVGGRCVPPDCTPEDPESCGPIACSTAEDCPRPADCADALCIEGTCLVAPRSGGCPQDTWCHPERGCVALPDQGDGGTGTTCTAEPERCNGADDDCDGETDEDFDLSSDVRNCGSCGQACASEHGTASCEAGACVLRCDEGYADCDGDPANGCEADLTSPESCGACGTRCEGATPLCVAGADGTYRCVSECPSDAPTLCGASCVDTASSLAHCGGCDRPCEVAHGTPACSGGSCRLERCDEGWGDCDGDPANGCETDLTAASDCGRCGNACPPSSPYCAADGSGGLGCTDGCSDGVRGGDESDVDCGGSLCAPCSQGRRCNVDRDCDATLVCRGGTCVPCGECTPGETQEQSCGNCGTQTRSCTASCIWGSWGPCTGEGVCAPGTTDTQPCGNCGTQSRSCTASCSWGSWGSCTGQGVCSPGTTETQSCGNCGTRSRTCNAACGWDGWGACTGEGVCSPGQTQSQSCGNCGTQTRSCTASCSWGSWGVCTGEGACSPGSRDSAGCPNPCMAKSCDSSCSWSAECSACNPSCSSSLPQCGTTCPPGYYASRIYCSNGCASDGWCGVGDPANAADCRRACGSSFNQCGTTCPPGYYASRIYCSNGCASDGWCGVGDLANAAECRLIRGTTFTQCGTTCPAGYRATRTFCSNGCAADGWCSVGESHNAAECRRY